MLHLAQDETADQLLSEDPLALLIGMVLDQQIPLERAFSAPRDLKDRLGGTLDAAEIADFDPEKLSELFAMRPALHRFPASNAKRVQELCTIVVDEYGGRAADIWEQAADGEDLYRRIKALPGFGDQKARIFIGLLGKQLGLDKPGWQEAAGKFGQPGTYMSVADITDASSLDRVRGYKKQLKAAAKTKS
jgi:uncharacterized HhH-GPD family protein